MTDSSSLSGSEPSAGFWPSSSREEPEKSSVDPDETFLLEPPTHRQAFQGRFPSIYEDVELVARTRLSTTWSAFNRDEQTLVVIKEPTAVVRSGGDAAERFRQEIRIVASLDHANILHIKSTNLDTRPWFFTMPFVTGKKHLDEYCEANRLSIEDRLTLFLKVCAAVSYAHEHGVIHRDLKPNNILVTEDGEPKLIDFGLGRQIDAASDDDAAESGRITGAFGYMSPEQASGSSGSTRTDVYGLGAVLYKLLTGRVPIEPVTNSISESLRRIREDIPPEPRTLQKGLHPELNAIARKALEKNPEGRFGSVADFARNVRQHLAGDPIDIWRRHRWYVLRKTVWKHRISAAITAAVILSLMVALVVTVRARRQAEWRGYLANIGAAGHALRLGDVVEAKNRLEAVPKQFQTSWEWRYLDGQLDQSIDMLKGHEGPVLCVAFSPDGTWLASGSEDGAVKSWDAKTGQEKDTLFRGHTGAVWSIAIGAGGDTIASASSQAYYGEVKLWNAHSGIELPKLAEGPGFPVRSVALHPQEKMLVAGASGSEANTGDMAIWDLVTGERSFRDRAHGWAVNGIAFMPDGTRFVTGGVDGKLKVWDSATEEELDQWEAHAKHDGVQGLAVSPDGRRIVSASKDQTLKVWDAETRTELCTLRGHRRIVQAVAFAPDGVTLASASADKTVRLWDAETGDQLAVLLGHKDMVQAVAFSPDGMLCASASYDGAIRLWDPWNTAHAIHTPHRYVNAIAFSPDGSLLASAGRDETTILWDVASRRRVRPPAPHQDEVKCLAFSPAGDLLVTGIRADIGQPSAITVWEVATGEMRLRFDAHLSDIRSVAVGWDGTRLVSGGIDGSVSLWNLENGTELRTFGPKAGPVTSVAFSPEGRHIVAGSRDDGTVRIWDVTTDAQPLSLVAHTREVRSVAFSPDGRLIASASADRTVRLWNTRTRKEMGSPLLHSDGVTCVACSPNGKRIVSGCCDHTVKLWDVRTGDEIITLHGHRAPVTDVAFSPPNGNVIASADTSGEVRLWRAAKSAVTVEQLHREEESRESDESASERTSNNEPPK